MQRYSVLRTLAIEHDLERIENYLFETYRSLGEHTESAGLRSAERLREASAYIRTFATYPHRGTELPLIRQGLRSVTSNRFVFYFEIDEPLLEVRLFAVFFGGLEHRKQIAERLMPR